MAIATWTRDPVPEEVISVMAATMLGSIETIAGVFGWPRVASIEIETEQHRMLVRQVNSSAFLVIMSPTSTRPSVLRKEARRIAARIASWDAGEGGTARSPTPSDARPDERLVEILRD